MVNTGATCQEIITTDGDVGLDAVVSEDVMHGLRQAGAAVGGRGILDLSKQVSVRIALVLTGGAILVVQHGRSDFLDQILLPRVGAIETERRVYIENGVTYVNDVFTL